MKASRANIPNRLHWLLKSSGWLWVAACTSVAASSAALHLGRGAYELTLNRNGALVAWQGQFNGQEEAQLAVAGEIRFGDKILKLEAPQVTGTAAQVSFTYRWPARPGLEVTIRHQATKDHGALLWNREFQIRSESRLSSDLTVCLQSWPKPLPGNTWLPLLDGTGAVLGTNEAAAFRFAGALPSKGVLLALPLVSFPAPAKGSRVLVAADPYFSTLFTPLTLERTYSAKAGLENGCEPQNTERTTVKPWVGISNQIARGVCSFSSEPNTQHVSDARRSSGALPS